MLPAARRRDPEGTRHARDSARQRERRDRRLCQSVNEINYLALHAWLRTKGSWVRFLPAAPIKTRVSTFARANPFVFVGRLITCFWQFAGNSAQPLLQSRSNLSAPVAFRSCVRTAQENQRTPVSVPVRPVAASLLGLDVDVVAEPFCLPVDRPQSD